MRDKLSLPQATILQLIYQQKSYEGNARDYEFSQDPCMSIGRTAMRTR
jgi:NTE family protein